MLAWRLRYMGVTAEAVAAIPYQRDEFSAASKRRVRLVVPQPQSTAATQFEELARSLARV